MPLDLVASLMDSFDAFRQELASDPPAKRGQRLKTQVKRVRDMCAATPDVAKGMAAYLTSLDQEADALLAPVNNWQQYAHSEVCEYLRSERHTLMQTS